MASREGKSRSPHPPPVAWKSPDFYDQSACETEMERVFDICHGCWRCVSLCHSFPTLFDLVDASAGGEVHGVAKKDFWSVVDQCYLCDLCFMTKCPYVPPHEWNVDFPHTMLRAKAIKFKNGEVGAGEKLLASTDTHGNFAGIPVVVQTVNALNKTKPMRKGVKTKFHAISMKIGKPVFKAMAKDGPDYISSDCALAGHHIAQGMANNALQSARLAHPLTLVRIA